MHTAPPPPPPPHGSLIELVRKAGRLSIQQAATAAGISKATWIDNARGYRKRGDTWEPVQPKPETIARMAAAVRLTPERLASEGEHPAAAEILAEIRRSEPPRLSVVPAPPSLADLPAEPTGEQFADWVARFPAGKERDALAAILPLADYFSPAETRRLMEVVLSPPGKPGEARRKGAG